MKLKHGETRKEDGHSTAKAAAAFNVVGAAGMAAVFAFQGAAVAQPAAPAAAKPDSVMVAPIAVSATTDSTKSAPQPVTAQGEAAKIIALDRQISLLRNGAKTPAEKTEYAALTKGIGKDKAMQGLLQQEVAAIRSLGKLGVEGITEKGIAIGTAAALDSLSSRIDMGESVEYMRDKPTMMRLSNGILTGSSELTAPGPENVAAERMQLPPIERSLFDPGAITLLNHGQNKGVSTLRGTPSSMVLSMCGSEQVAQDLVDALSTAEVVRQNSDTRNDPAANQRAAYNLYTVLQLIPSDKVIWQSEAFQKAITALSRGNLQDGLDLIRGDNAFNTDFFGAINLYKLNVNQRAVSVMRSGVTLRTEETGNVEDYNEVKSGVKKGPIWLRGLWASLSITHEYLLMTGELTRYRTHVDTLADSSTQVSLVSDSTQILEGNGHLFGITPQACFVRTIFGLPMELIVYGNVSYRTWALGTDVPMADGTTQRVEASENKWYVGQWGTEFDFHSKHKHTFISDGALGLATVGLDNPNPIVYLSLTHTWSERNIARLQTQLTMKYANLLGQDHLGGEVIPIDMAWQLNRWTLFTSPAVRGDYNFANHNITAEAYGILGVRLNNALSLDGRAGFVTEQGPARGERISQTAFGSVNLTWIVSNPIKP